LAIRTVAFEGDGYTDRSTSFKINYDYIIIRNPFICWKSCPFDWII